MFYQLWLNGWHCPLPVPSPLWAAHHRLQSSSQALSSKSCIKTCIKHENGRIMCGNWLYKKRVVEFVFIYVLVLFLWSEHRTACLRTDAFTSFSDASHCFCLTLLTGNIWKLTLLPCLFVQPIAAHDSTILLFDTSFYATLEKSSCGEHCSLWCTLREGGRKWAICHPLSHSW